MQYLVPLHGRIGTGTADAEAHLEVSSAGRLRYVVGRAGDNARAAVRVGTGRFTRAGLYLPATPAPGRTAYVEPSDYTTLSYQTNVQMTNAWVSANGTPGTGPSSRNAVWFTSTYQVLFRQCTFWGGAAGGTSGGIIGGPGGGGSSGGFCEYEDCTFVGSSQSMLNNGQSAGNVRFESYRRQWARNCNFIGAGFKPKQYAGTNTNPLHTAGMEFCLIRNINGRVRDSSTGSGWKEGSVQGTDYSRENAWQLDTATNIRGVRNRWNRVLNDLGLSEVEDVFNNYASYGFSDDWILVEHNLIEGGYPLFVPQPYYGGGIMLGDGRGRYQLAQYNTVLNTSNYGLAISGGNDMAHNDSLVLGRNRRESDGVRSDTNPDSGIYVHEYNFTDTNGGIVASSRQMNRNTVGWMAGTSGGTYFRKDGLSIESTGTGTANAAYIPAGGSSSSDIPLADIDAARAQWFSDYAAANGTSVVGRRNPA